MVSCRTAAFTNMGLAAKKDGQKPPLITMLKKKGRRIIENADEIMHRLERVFPWARFRSLEGSAVASMSIKQQVSWYTAHMHGHAIVNEVVLCKPGISARALDKEWSQVKFCPVVRHRTACDGH